MGQPQNECVGVLPQVFCHLSLLEATAPKAGHRRGRQGWSLFHDDGESWRHLELGSRVRGGRRNNK